MDLFENIPYGIENIITDSMTESVLLSPLVSASDVTVITPVLVEMLYKIADYHDVSFTAEEYTKIIIACSSCYLGRSNILSDMQKFLPTGWYIDTMVYSVIFNGYHIYSLGKAFHLMLEDYDINGKTILEISKILINMFVPFSSDKTFKTLEAIVALMKEKCYYSAPKIWLRY